MSDIRQLKKRLLKDPEVFRHYKAITPEFDKAAEKLRMNETPAVFDSCGLVAFIIGCAVLELILIVTEVVLVWKQAM